MAGVLIIFLDFRSAICKGKTKKISENSGSLSIRVGMSTFFSRTSSLAAKFRLRIPFELFRMFSKKMS